jgi:ATP-dependent DNA helicase PIF1
MLIKNLDETLVNGSIGRVDRFVLPSLYGTKEDKGFQGTPLPPQAAQALNPKKSTAEIGQALEYPVIHFLMPDGGRREVLAMPEQFKVELPSGEIQASRTQVS